MNKDSKEGGQNRPVNEDLRRSLKIGEKILWKGSDEDEIFIEKVNKNFQTIGEIISGLVDNKSDLNLKKPFQKAGQL